MDDLKEYQKKCEEIQKQNDQLLELFKEDLVNDGLSAKTIRNHIGNADFYINNFLLRYEPQTFEAGLMMSEINDFLGDFFIRKCMWSTPASIKTTAASIKKFYKSMLAHGKIDRDDYEELCSTIKNYMEDWQQQCAAYNDPDEQIPFDFF